MRITHVYALRNLAANHAANARNRKDDFLYHHWIGRRTYYQSMIDDAATAVAKSQRNPFARPSRAG